jgi:hypothetical protein
MKSRLYASACGALIVSLGLAAMSAQAQYEHHGGPEPHGSPGAHGPGPQHFDGRYSHNHYYAPHGAYVGVVPGRPVVVGGGRYFYSGGVWYAPRGPGFVVVAAPVGMFIPVLPPYYTTVWVGGLPYYYANDTYYMWDATQSGYQVVDPPNGNPNVPPSGSVTTNGQAPPNGDELYIYPQNGQSEDQQATDKYECHKWATSQSGFDPTQAGGGVAPDQVPAARAAYQRAMGACLVGRGYSVR